MFHSLVALDELAVGQLLHVYHLGQVMLKYYPCVRSGWRRSASVRVRRSIPHPLSHAARAQQDYNKHEHSVVVLCCLYYSTESPRKSICGVPCSICCTGLMLVYSSHYLGLKTSIALPCLTSLGSSALHCVTSGSGLRDSWRRTDFFCAPTTSETPSCMFFHGMETLHSMQLGCSWDADRPS